VAHVKLFIHQCPQVLLVGADLNPFIPQPVFVVGDALTQTQDLSLHTGLPLQLVQVPLGAILSLGHVSCTTQFSVICKLAEGALDLTKSLMKMLNSTSPSTDP